MNKLATLLIGLWVAILLAACGSSAGTTKRDNIAYLYGKGGTGMSLQARVYHPTADRSTLYYKIPTRDLLYKSAGGGAPYHAVIRISYETYADWSSRTPLDSASTVVQDSSMDLSEDKELIGSLELKPSTRQSYVLKVTAKDLNRDLQSTLAIGVRRDGSSPRQFFLPLDPRNSLPLFDDHLLAGTTLKLRSEVFVGRTLQGAHHAVDAGLPSPVFTTGTAPKKAFEAPDSTFTVELGSDEDSFLITLDRPGIYHLRPDTANEHGFTLFVMGYAYPYVASETDLLKPLRYITSMQEYDRISAAPSIRGAVERFWLDAAGDRERAREAIRIYYGRVENANRHFTTQVEGWRTDRGLVHIIFGTPTSIYRSENSETWIFGEENNLMSLNFTFTKRSGPFSDNDLVLQRDPMLKGAWYRNVESWRNGRVYQN